MLSDASKLCRRQRSVGGCYLLGSAESREQERANSFRSQAVARRGFGRANAFQVPEFSRAEQQILPQSIEFQRRARNPLRAENAFAFWMQFANHRRGLLR